MITLKTADAGGTEWDEGDGAVSGEPAQHDTETDNQMLSENADRNDHQSLVHDWDEGGRAPAGTIELDDETLRDGLQSPTITQPTVEQKIQLVHLMTELSIQAADIGLPGAGEKAAADVTAIAKEIARAHLPIAPNCAARTMPVDVTPIIEASQAAGIEIEVSLFIGSSRLRQYVENWTVDHILRTVETAVRYAIDHGLPVMLVTEDTTRSDPDFLHRVYSTGIACGARRICCADTIGFATPRATGNLVRFARGIIRDSGEDVKLDWHGHCDRGLGLANALAAVEAGADRVHGTAIGIGERCGNVPMEVLLVNLKLLGYIDSDLTRLVDYCRLTSETCNVPIAHGNPVVGRDAFRTSTGVHAAAVVKAMKKSDDWLVDRVYSSVPASWVGRTQRIDVGPMSGAANVVHWLESHGYESQPELVKTILDVAKRSTHTLDPLEIEVLIERVSR